MKIETAFGTRHVVRRVGVAGEYYETLPTGAAPHGEWWTLNPQHGFVPVASNSRGLLAALAEGAPDMAGDDTCPCGLRLDEPGHAH